MESLDLPGNSRAEQARLIHGRYGRAEEKATAILLRNECPE